MLTARKLVGALLDEAWWGKKTPPADELQPDPETTDRVQGWVKAKPQPEQGVHFPEGQVVAFGPHFSQGAAVHDFHEIIERWKRNSAGREKVSDMEALNAIMDQGNGFIVQSGQHPTVYAKHIPVKVGKFLMDRLERDFGLNDERYVAYASDIRLHPESKRIDQIFSGEEVQQTMERPRLGVELSRNYPEADTHKVEAGALVVDVSYGGAADVASVKSGDVIQYIGPFKAHDEKKAGPYLIRNPRDLTNALRLMANEKQRFPVTVLRHGRRIELPVVFDPDMNNSAEGKMPAPPPET